MIRVRGIIDDDTLTVSLKPQQSLGDVQPEQYIESPQHYTLHALQSISETARRVRDRLTGSLK